MSTLKSLVKKPSTQAMFVLLLWAISVEYQAYTGLFNGPLTLVLKEKGFLSWAITGFLYAGLIAGAGVEKLLERFLPPAAIAMVAISLLTGSIWGYFLLLAWGETSPIPFILCRIAEGIAATTFYDSIFFLFKQHYGKQKKTAEAISRRNAATATSLGLASITSYYLVDTLSHEKWLLYSGCIVVSSIALLCIILFTLSRSSNIAYPEKEKAQTNTDTNNNNKGNNNNTTGVVAPISHWAILFLMLGVIAPTATVHTLLTIHLPGDVGESYPDPPVVMVWSSSMFLLGSVAGSLSAKQFATNWQRYQLFAGCLPIVGGLALLAIGGHNIRVLLLSQVMLGWGIYVVSTLVEITLQRLSLNLSKQEGMKSLAIDFMRFLSVFVFGVIADKTERLYLWLAASPLPFIGACVLPKWSKFILRHLPQEEAPQQVTLTNRVKFALLGLGLWFCLLWPR